MSPSSTAIDAITLAWGGVDVLVNNAGITQLGRFVDTDVDVIRRVVDVNLFGAVNCTKAALPSLLDRRGMIIVTSSVAGVAVAALTGAVIGLLHGVLTVSLALSQHAVESAALLGAGDLARIGRAHGGDGVAVLQSRLHEADLAMKLQPLQVKETIGQTQYLSQVGVEHTLVGQVVHGEHGGRARLGARQRQVQRRQSGVPVVGVQYIGLPCRVATAVR